jgi:enamine deaminase RidA (YjgF/YER057c/UK114 family)
MGKMELKAPEDWPRAKGYAHGVAASGTLIFVSGQVGWDAQGRFATDDLAGQVRTALENVAAVLAAGGARPEHIARMTWFVTDKREYLRQQREIGEAYRTVMGKHFPAMSVVEVSGLVEERAKVEIEATAVVPE